MSAEPTLAWPLIASWSIDPRDGRFDGHFPGQLMVPGAYLLDGALQRIEAALGLRIGTVRSAKFSAFALPGETVNLHAQQSGQRVRFALHGTAGLLCTGEMGAQT